MKYLTLSSLLILLLCTVTQAQKRYDELEGSYPELNEFLQPEIETFTMENSITFYLVEDNELPLINMDVNIRTGGVLVPNEKTGLASITGTVIRSGGTQKYPPDSLNALLENNAAGMETGIGFSSGSGSMNVLKEDFENLLPVFVDLLVNPEFPEDKIELAKTQRKSNISRRNDDAQSIAFREFDRLIYGKNSVYGRNTEYETIDNITRQDIVRFHKDHFVGRNISVGLVGDFDSDTIKEKLKKAFEKVPAATETELNFPEVDYTYKSSINFIDKPDVNQSVVLLGHLGGMRDNPDYPKIQVMNQVLSGGFSGRLFQVVRSDLGLAYSVFGSYQMQNFYPGVFYTGVMTKSATTSEAIDAILKEIRRLQNEPVTHEELQNTKDQFLNSLVFRFDSYEKVLTRRMSNDYRGLPEDVFDRYVEGVKATSIQDVREVARKYLKPDKMEILVVGNGEEIDNQLQKYGEVNNIDITIPRPGDNEELTRGDASKGSELLKKMAGTLIEKGKEINSLTISGETTQFNPDNPAQERSIQATTILNFPNTLRLEMVTPQGTQTMLLKDGQATVQMGSREQQLPPPMTEEFQNQLNRDYINIARQGGELKAEYLGSDTVEGEKLEKIRVETGDETHVIYLIDPETNLPRAMRYTRFNPQAGNNINIEVRYSDWKKTEGISYAYMEVTYHDGTKSSETEIKSVNVNNGN